MAKRRSKSATAGAPGSMFSPAQWWAEIWTRQTRWGVTASTTAEAGAAWTGGRAETAATQDEPAYSPRLVSKERRRRCASWMERGGGEDAATWRQKQRVSAGEPPHSGQERDSREAKSVRTEAARARKSRKGRVRAAAKAGLSQTRIVRVRLRWLRGRMWQISTTEGGGGEEEDEDEAGGEDEGGEDVCDALRLMKTTSPVRLFLT